MKKMLLTNQVTIKKAIYLLAFCLLMLAPLPGFSQSDPVLDDDLELPCGGDDPYATDCPVDSWTSLLVVGGVILGAVTISIAQKRSDKAKNLNYLDNLYTIKNNA